jgi:hypothetical protein
MSYYEGRIKVVCHDLTCFPVDPTTLEPLACGSYDPWAISDPEQGPLETIGTCEWYRRLDVIHESERRERREYWRKEATTPCTPIPKPATK